MSEASSPAADPPAPPGWPWSQRWIDRLAPTPAWAGLAFALAHLLLGIAYYGLVVEEELAAGWSAYRRVLSSSAVFALLIGYAPAALAYARRGHQRAFEELRPRLRGSEAQLREAARQIDCFDRTSLRAVGLLAASISIAVTFFTTGIRQSLGPGNPALLWVLWQNALAFWLVARTIGHDLRVSRLFGCYAEQWAEIDVLDQVPLAPLARRGLQSALLIILAISIFSLLFGVGHVSPVVPFTQLLTVGLAGLALLLPSLGVHRRLRAARREELEALARELRAARSEAADPARLASLLALRQHLQAARVWPFDLGTLGRFVLYAAIGVGSWLGAALVERLLDRILR